MYSWDALSYYFTWFTLAYTHTHTNTTQLVLQIAKHLFSTDLMIMIFGKFATVIIAISI